MIAAHAHCKAYHSRISFSISRQMTGRATQPHGGVCSGGTPCAAVHDTDTVVRPTLQRDHLLRAIQTVPCIAEKASWAFKWITSATSFAERLLAFACVEGVHFSGR